MGKGLGDWNASVTCIFSWQHSLTEGNGQPSVDCSRVDYAHAVGWKRGAGRMDIYIYYVYGIYKDMFRVVSPETGRMPACNIDFGGPASSGAQRYHHWQAIHVSVPYRKPLYIICPFSCGFLLLFFLESLYVHTYIHPCNAYIHA